MTRFTKEWWNSDSPRATVWASVPDEQWNSWRWQLSKRLNSVEDLQEVIHLTPDETKALQSGGKFRVDITPYFASLMDPDDPNCPVRLQVVPRARELETFDAQMEDSLSEESHSPVHGLVHRYPDRVLMLATTQCASYCRYCTRSRIVGDPHATYGKADWDAQIAYIEQTPQVRDVLISGGDPLTMKHDVLEGILERLSAIPHVEIVRIGTRVPVFLPQRITDELVNMLARFHPLWINIHVNHPKEITPEVARACDRLTRAGIPLGNQSVLLAGVNDCPNIQKALVQKLTQIRVRPYYLYICDLVEGAGHFRTSVDAGIEIIEALRGHTSGFAVPTFVIDAPGGGGKVPVMPNYLLSKSNTRTVVRNFEGYITTYTEPEDYPHHDPTTCSYCQNKWPEPGQRGVAGLLAGEQLALKTAEFELAHLRGRLSELDQSVDALPAE